VVPGPKVWISHEFLSVVAWAILSAGRMVIVVAPADGSKAARKAIDRAEILTKGIVARRWRILRQELVKIVRGDGLFGHMEWLETGGPDREYAVDVLHFTMDNEIRVI
jgi:hypothetical protein